MVGISTSQSGRVAELFAAAMLICASDGRLSPYAPLADDHGVDLIVHDKLGGGSLALQVKSWFVPADAARGPVVQFDVRKATFRPRADAALLALVLDARTVGLEVAWLIPFDALPGVAADRPDKFVLTPSRSPVSADRYAAFRHSEATSIARAIVGSLSCIGD